MHTRLERASAAAGVLAVVLWILGIVVTNAMSDKIPHHPTDAQLLAWVKGSTNSILLGGWLFMLGCVAFVWFAAVLRSRLAAAEGPSATFANLAFAGAGVAAGFGMLTQVGDVGAAIDKNDISAATAGTLHHASDSFFVAAELAAILLVAGFAASSLRTRAFPKWWAIFALVVALILVIGPIGWVGLIFGLPVWTLGTTWLLFRPERPARRSHVAAATT
jgi:hypothetical protein